VKRPTKWTVLSLVAGISFAAIPSASAQACPVLQVSCVAEQLDAIEETTDEVSDEVEGTIGGTLGAADDTLGRLLGGDPGGHEPPPPEDGETDAGNGPRDGEGGSGQRDPDGAWSGSAPDPRETAPFLAGGARSAIRGPRSGGLEPPVAQTPPPRATEADEVSLAEAVAPGVVVVLILSALVLVFTAVQNRFDRRDPRLMLAPVRSETVTFG